MSRIKRTERVKVSLTPDEAAAIKARAAAHGVPPAVYVRNAAFGLRPDSTPGTATARADAWWDGMTARQRVGVHKWLGKVRHMADSLPGQPALIDMGDATDG